MYTNGNRYPTGSSLKRKPENGTDEVPAKQLNYCNPTNTRTDVANSKQFGYMDAMGHPMFNESNQNMAQLGPTSHFGNPPAVSYAYHDPKQYGFKQPEMPNPEVPPPFLSGRHPMQGHPSGMHDGPGPGQAGHDAPSGPGRAWGMRGRGPMRGFRGHQWRGGPLGPPRGFYHGRGRGGPPYPQQNFQANEFGGWNQGYPPHHSGPPPKKFHPQAKNKKNKEVSGSSEGTEDRDNKEKVDKPDVVERTSKRRKNAVRIPVPTRPWCREDAEKALKVEIETTRALRNQSLIIRFPDPELSRDIVKKYHPGIQNVHFQVPSGPRYCFVQLSPRANADKVIKVLENIEFGSGRLTVEKKSSKQDEDVSPDAIDPYTLYIGNLPTNVNISTVKEKFPNAARVDVGFAQRMRFTRYAFIRFNHVDEAIKSYKENHSLVLDSRSIIVRFRRQKGQMDLPGETKVQHPSKMEHCKLKTVESEKLKKDDKDIKTEEDVKEEKERNMDDSEDEDEEEEEDEEEDDSSHIGGDDDDDDDDDDEEDHKPIQDDDDDEDDDVAPPGAASGPILLPTVAGHASDADIDPPIIDDDEDDDPENLFRDLDAQLGDFDGFPFNLN